MQQYNEQAYTKFDNEALIQCKNCLRTFLPEPLMRHQKVCVPGRPLKMRTEPKKEKPEYYGAVKK